MQGQGGPKDKPALSVIAVSVTLLAIGLMAVAGASGATPRQLLQATPTPVYPIPTPTTTPTPSATPTPSVTPFQQNPPPPKSPAPSLMKPFPTIRTAGNFNRERTLFTHVKVTGPAGARIEGRCTRVARKCHTNLTISKKRRAVRLKRLQRRFKPKTVIRIRVTAPGVYGKYVVMKVRKGKPPTRIDRCVKPGTRKAVNCPSS
jgi:hypothetical protein